MQQNNGQGSIFALLFQFVFGTIMQPKKRSTIGKLSLFCLLLCRFDLLVFSFNNFFQVKQYTLWLILEQYHVLLVQRYCPWKLCLIAASHIREQSIKATKVSHYFVMIQEHQEYRQVWYNEVHHPKEFLYFECLFNKFKCRSGFCLQMTFEGIAWTWCQQDRHL